MLMTRRWFVPLTLWWVHCNTHSFINDQLSRDRPLVHLPAPIDVEGDPNTKKTARDAGVMEAAWAFIARMAHLLQQLSAKDARPAVTLGLWLPRGPLRLLLPCTEVRLAQSAVRCCPDPCQVVSGSAAAIDAKLLAHLERELLGFRRPVLVFLDWLLGRLLFVSWGWQLLAPDDRREADVSARALVCLTCSRTTVRRFPRRPPTGHKLDVDAWHECAHTRASWTVRHCTAAAGPLAARHPVLHRPAQIHSDERQSGAHGEGSGSLGAQDYFQVGGTKGWRSGAKLP